MKKIMLFVLVSVLSIIMGCGQEQSEQSEQSYIEGTIEEVDENNITMLVIENESRVGKTDKVWLTRGQSVNFEAFEKGQRIKAWVSDAFVGLTGIPQVMATKIEIIQ